MNEPLDPETLTISIAHQVSDLDPAAWDRLVGDGSPFVEHAWLAAMERSGAVDSDRGWSPHILIARDTDDQLVGAVPLYLKGHSYGEYVYDWAWADVANRLGVRYYPKLIAASPFSPVTGPRILVDPDAEPERAEQIFDGLVSSALRLASMNEIHGVHWLFLEEPVARKLKDHGLILRQAHQYHWHNDGYADFDDFLDRFKSKRRREIRRERRRLAEGGYRVEAVRGTELTEEQMDAVFRFYATTCERYMYGRRYLDRAFFAEIHAHMPERILAMLAYDKDDTLIAGTFNLRKGDRLYGRYWGADRDVPFLHFETCFYSTIAYCIAEGIQVMEPGAGGDHKYVRGFEAETMYSAHWLANPKLSAVLAQITENECERVDEMVEHLAQRSPLKRLEPGEGEGEGV